MADHITPREQVKRCQQWLKQHSTNPDIAYQAKDSVLLLLHNAQCQLNSKQNNA